MGHQNNSPELADNILSTMLTKTDQPARHKKVLEFIVKNYLLENIDDLSIDGFENQVAQEVGLDYFVNHITPDIQLEGFLRMVEAAIKKSEVK